MKKPSRHQLAERLAQKLQVRPDRMQISIGLRQVYGPIRIGFCNRLDPERFDLLDSLLTQPSNPNINPLSYSQKIPDIEIKAGAETVFRRELDGVISINAFYQKSQPQQPHGSNLLPTATNSFTQQLNKLSGVTKSFLQGLLRELGQQTVKATANISSIPQQQQQRRVADTTLKLMQQHYKSTGETSYQTENYQLDWESDNNYVIRTHSGQELLRFKMGLAGPKVLASQLNQFHYQDFERARVLLQTDPRHDLTQLPEQRLAQLGNLAPLGDRSVVELSKTQQTLETAKDLLRYLNVSAWDAGNKGNYKITGGEDFLRVEAKDGRGCILELKDGQLDSDLTARDFSYFQRLQQQLQSQPPKQISPLPAVVRFKPEQLFPITRAHNLAAIITARNLLDSLETNVYESDRYRFERRNLELTVTDKHGRGVIARLDQHGEISGNLSEQDVLHLNQLNQAVLKGTNNNAHLQTSEKVAAPVARQPVLAGNQEMER